MDMGSSSSPGKQQPQSLKVMVIGGRKPNTFSVKSTDLSAVEASSSDAVSSTAATSMMPSQGGQPSSISSPHQQPMSASVMGKRDVKQEIDRTLQHHLLLLHSTTPFHQWLTYQQK